MTRIRNGRLVVRNGKLCIGETCPPPCADDICCPGYTIPHGKRWKITVPITIETGNGQCECCESIAGPFFLQPIGGSNCNACCFRVYCVSLTFGVDTPDHPYNYTYLIYAVFIEVNNPCGRLRVTLRNAAMYGPTADYSDVLDECSDTSFIYGTGRHDTTYSLDISGEPPGDLAGPYTLTTPTSPFGLGWFGFIPWAEFLTPCKRVGLSPTTITAELVNAEPGQGCGEVDGDCGEPNPQPCVGGCDGEPPASVFVTFSNVLDCCFELQDSSPWEFGLDSENSTPCCLLYTCSFVLVGCVGVNFHAAFGNVLICYSPEDNETTILFFWTTFGGDISLAPGGNRTESGALDCTDFSWQLDEEGMGDGCSGNLRVKVEA